MEQESVLTSSSEHIAHFIQSEGSSQFTWPSHWTLSEIPSYPLVSQYVRKYLNLSFFFSEEFFIVVHNLLRVLSPSENTCKSSGSDSVSEHFMAFINTHLALIAAILSCTNTLYDTPNSVFLRFYFLIFFVRKTNQFHLCHYACRHSHNRPFPCTRIEPRGKLSTDNGGPSRDIIARAQFSDVWTCNGAWCYVITEDWCDISRLSVGSDVMGQFYGRFPLHVGYKWPCL